MPGRRQTALAAALLRSAGEPALRRALPLYVGIGMTAAVIFGPTGMNGWLMPGVLVGLPGQRV